MTPIRPRFLPQKYPYAANTGQKRKRDGLRIKKRNPKNGDGQPSLGIYLIEGEGPEPTVLHFRCGKIAAVGSTALTVRRTVIRYRLALPGYEASYEYLNRHFRHFMNLSARVTLPSDCLVSVVIFPVMSLSIRQT